MQKGKYNKINVLFIICFLLLIAIPVIRSDKIGGKMSNVENRYLAKFPSIVDENNNFNLTNFRNNFENYINDNIGFRTQASKIVKIVNYKCFDIFPSQNVFEGKEKWLYFIPSCNTFLVSNNRHPSIDDIKSTEDKLFKIVNFFKTKDINFIYMMCPSKQTIYPEYIDNGFNVNSDICNIDIFDKYFSNDKFNFITPLKELRREKEKRLVYSKANDVSHWNNYGAFIGYMVLMNKVKEYIPNLNILRFSDFNIKEIEKQTNIFGLFQATEIDYEFEPLFLRTAVEDKSFFDCINYKSNDIYMSYNYFINQDKFLPKAVIIVDSYIWMFMLPNLAESFSELCFIHMADIDKLHVIIDKIKPDIVIGESLESICFDEIISSLY